MNDLKNEQCPICLDHIINFNDKNILDCGHYYHKICINKYFDTSCPICKKQFITSNIYYINNTNQFEFKNIILINNLIIKKLTNYLSLEIVLNLLTNLNNNTILSGQFILSIIQNSNENINQLDIYIDNYSKYKKYKKFCKKYFTLQSTNLNSLGYLSTNNKIINQVKTYIYNNFYINIIFNNNNIFTLKTLFKLDLLKNYYDGNYFYTYNISKLELKIDYISKYQLNEYCRELILYYRSIDYKILITE